MLYSNKTYIPHKREMKFGDLYCIELGEEGRGRKCEIIPVPPNLAEIKEGMNPNLTITETKSGRPRISYTKEKDPKFMYILLDTYYSYHRGHNGYVDLIQLDGTRKLLEANKAAGDAGRMGRYECVLAVVPNDEKRRYIKVRLGGAYYKESYDYHILVCEKNNAFLIKNTELELFFDSRGEEMPPQLKHEDLLYKDYSVKQSEFNRLYETLKGLKQVDVKELALNQTSERVFLADDGNIMYNESNITDSKRYLTNKLNNKYVIVSKETYIYLSEIRHTLLHRIGSLSFDNDDFILCTYDKYNLIFISYMDFINDNGYLNKSTSIAQRKTIKL